MSRILPALTRFFNKSDSADSSVDPAVDGDSRPFPEKMKDYRKIVMKATDHRPPDLSAVSLAEYYRVTDSAIAIFKRERVPKRNMKGEIHRSLAQARRLFEEAAHIVGFSVPGGLYNFGVCLYHFNLFQSGHMNVDAAVAIGTNHPHTPDAKRVVLYGKFFIRYVTEIGPTWLRMTDPVNPALFMSSNSNDYPPTRQEFDPDVLM